MERLSRQIFNWPSPLDPVIYTAVLVAYFLPWIDHPAAGLTLIGLDVSEWVKFLPQMQSGELPNRDLFYLPPLCLGGCLAATTLLMKQRFGRPAWFLRFLGLAVGLLAFPSLDAIRFEPADQWQPRLIWIGILAVWAFIVGPLIGQFVPRKSGEQLANLALFVLAAAGAILPAVVLIPTRRVMAEWLVVEAAVGWGFWLGFLGFMGLGVLGAGRFIISLKEQSGRSAASLKL